MFALYAAILLAVTSHPVTSQSISRFTLEANGTKRAFSDGDYIVLDVDLPPLSILVDTTGEDEDIDFVRLDLDDGATIRTEYKEPYYLGGDFGGAPNHVFSLEDLGIHTLRATVEHDDVVLDEQLISFNIVQAASEVPGPGFIPPKNGGGDGGASPISQPPVFVDKEKYEASSGGTLNGELMVWHRVTLGFTAFPTSETNVVENPFAHYRLDVTFVHEESGTVFVVPGFYGADGNSVNSGRPSGSVWLCHFVPNQEGAWTWEASFVRGIDVAAHGIGESASFFDGDNGNFVVLPSDKTGKDFRSKGLVQEVIGKTYMRHTGTGESFLPIAISMDGMLGNPEFANTIGVQASLGNFAAHKRDYGLFVDETWNGGQGQGLVGALNYLSDTGINTLEVNAISDEIFPFISPTQHVQYDVSKLSQWEIIFTHAGSVGFNIGLSVEHESLGEELDVVRMIYYRELVARFSHLLGLTWDLRSAPGAQLQTFADYLQEIDPYGHPCILNAEESDTSISIWERLMTGSSIAYDTTCAPDCGDFRKSSLVSGETAHTLDFFDKLPVKALTSSSSTTPLNLHDNLSTLLVVYIGDGETATVMLPNMEPYNVGWYDVSTGGSLQLGSISTVVGGNDTSIGSPPHDGTMWVAVLSAPGVDLGALASTAASN